MKTLLVSAALVAASAGISSTQVSEQVTASRPWQVGQCYRVFPADRDTIYTFKVLEPPSGPWIRVMALPSTPLGPGAKPQAALWINSASTFAVQEWSCTDM
jgi:hypothetical protein